MPKPARIVPPRPQLTVEGENSVKDVRAIARELAEKYPRLEIRVTDPITGQDVGFLTWNELRKEHEYFGYATAEHYMTSADLFAGNTNAVYPIPRPQAAAAAAAQPTPPAHKPKRGSGS